MEKKWRDWEVKMEENANKAKQWITLDIGGTIFVTSKSTLLRYEDTLFHASLMKMVQRFAIVTISLSL